MKLRQKDILRAINAQDNEKLREWCESGELDPRVEVMGELPKHIAIERGNISALLLFMQYGVKLEEEDLSMASDMVTCQNLSFLLSLSSEKE